LRDDQYSEALEQIGDISAGLRANAGPSTGKERQVFTKDFVGCDDFVRREGAAQLHGSLMRGILGAGHGGPVKRIGENNAHKSRLGTP
jgi:hypothetical protein